MHPPEATTVVVVAAVDVVVGDGVAFDAVVETVVPAFDVVDDVVLPAFVVVVVAADVVEAAFDVVVEDVVAGHDATASSAPFVVAVAGRVSVM